MESIKETAQLIFYIGTVLGIILAYLQGKKLKGFKLPPIDVRLAPNSEPLHVQLCPEDRERIDQIGERIERLEGKLNGTGGPPTPTPIPLP